MGTKEKLVERFKRQPGDFTFDEMENDYPQNTQEPRVVFFKCHDMTTFLTPGPNDVHDAIKDCRLCTVMANGKYGHRFIYQNTVNQHISFTPDGFRALIRPRNPSRKSVIQ